MHEFIRLIQQIQEAGYMGWLAIIGLYAAACVFLIPGSFLTVACGTIYGFWVGILLVIAGHTLGSMVCLLITRYFLRKGMTKILRHYPKVRAIKNVVQRRGWRVVVLIRLSPIMPFSLITYALGLTDISVAKFLFATGIGALPSVCLYVYIGTLVSSVTKIDSVLHKHQSWEWILQGGRLLITILVTIWITHLAMQSLKNNHSTQVRRMGKHH